MLLDKRQVPERAGNAALADGPNVAAAGNRCYAVEEEAAWGGWRIDRPAGAAPAPMLGDDPAAGVGSEPSHPPRVRPRSRHDVLGEDVGVRTRRLGKRHDCP